jgi:hypothetical protein
MKTHFSAFPYEREFRTGFASSGYSDNYLRCCADNIEAETGGGLRTAMNCVAMYSAGVMLRGRGVDYFITSLPLLDSILGMVKSFTADVLDVLVESNLEAMVIHPPSPRPAVLVGVGSANGNTMAVFFDGKEITSLGTLAFRTKQRLTTDDYTMRLGVGLALYARFFPEAVMDDIPDIAKHPSHYRSRKCKSVKIARELLDRSGPIPHIRQCYFKFLGSDFYTRKRGRIILVRECYVKGKCKIVVEAEDLPRN